MKGFAAHVNLTKVQLGTYLKLVPIVVSKGTSCKCIAESNFSIISNIILQHSTRAITPEVSFSLDVVTHFVFQLD